MTKTRDDGWVAKQVAGRASMGVMATLRPRVDPRDADDGRSAHHAAIRHRNSVAGTGALGDDCINHTKRHKQLEAITVVDGPSGARAKPRSLDMVLRDIDAEYDELMDELEEVVNAGSADCGERIQVIRRRIDELLRAQMGQIARQLPDRRTQIDALN